MFGVVVAGRLVQTNFKQIDPTKYIFDLQDPQIINHIVVFLTGVEPFPPGYGATVHFYWPGTSSSWILLGVLTNDKPSAIFRLGTKKTLSHANTAALFGNSGDMSMSDHSALQYENVQQVAQLGVSIEPIDAVYTQASTLPPVGEKGLSAAIAWDPVEFAGRMLENFVNHCLSFAAPMEGYGGWGGNFIPQKAVNDWYNKMLAKLSTDSAKQNPMSIL
ncbi:hypothetical protein BJ742DRAFT_793870 [Cladochytrium replicatum]|nr:hypothetical protein BJ742DRAFT_793870 [Cladochytrium replicatum]